MSHEIITHVFASLQSLEKNMSAIKQLASEQKHPDKEITTMVPQQEEVLATMRRTANHLQLHVAKKDSRNIVRSLQIFYGLHQMVRPDILKTFGKLTRERTLNAVTEQTALGKETMFH